MCKLFILRKYMCNYWLSTDELHGLPSSVLLPVIKQRDKGSFIDEQDSLTELSWSCRTAKYAHLQPICRSPSISLILQFLCPHFFSNTFFWVPSVKLRLSMSALAAKEKSLYLAYVSYSMLCEFSASSYLHLLSHRIKTWLSFIRSIQWEGKQRTCV